METQKPNVVFKSIVFKTSGIDAFQVMERLSQTNQPFFLLEGFEEWDGTSPYSYLGVNPFETLVIKEGELEVHSEGRHIQLEGNPFSILAERFKSYRATPPKKGEVAFRGGAIGYVGFECTKYFEKALRNKMKTADKDTVEALFMVFKNTIAVARDRTHIVITGSVFLDTESEDQGLQRVNKELNFLKEIIEHPTQYSFVNFDIKKALSETGKTLKIKSSLGKKNFIQAVKVAKEKIKNGEIFQCVLSDRFETDQYTSPLKVYEALRVTNPSPFMFYLFTGNSSLLGASPERLVKVSQGFIETNPIAGTRPRGKTAALDKKNEKLLLKSPKERAEHIMLVDLGRNDIGRVAEPASVKVEEFMEVKRFSDVMHMISKVKGRLKKELSSWDALASCFPAGTLSGAPKIRAVEIIEDLEMASREFYGGAIVKYEFDGSLDSCITIRSAQQVGKKYIFQAGAGIVADSNPSREYDEILAKTQSVRRAIALAKEHS